MSGFGGYTLSTSYPRVGRGDREQGEARIVSAEETGGNGTDGLLIYPTDRGHYATNVDAKVKTC